MSDRDEPLGAALFDAYAPPPAREDLADRVLARKPRRSRAAWIAVGACAAVAALGIALRRPVPRGFLVAGEETVVALGSGTARVSPGALLAWRGDRVFQLAGRISYTTHGGSLEVMTPSARIVDIGTRFDVEVGKMRKELALATGGIGVVLLVVAVHEGRVRLTNHVGALEIGAGEVAYAAPAIAPVPSGKVAPAPRSGPARITPGERLALIAAIESLRASRAGTLSGDPLAAPPPSGPMRKPWDRLQVIQETVAEINPLVQECFTLGAGQSGMIAVRFRVIGEPELGGLVEEVEIKEKSTIADPEVRQCIVETLKTLQFPVPEDNTDVFVNYPFRYVADEDEEPVGHDHGDD